MSREMVDSLARPGSWASPCTWVGGWDQPPLNYREEEWGGAGSQKEVMQETRRIVAAINSTCRLETSQRKGGHENDCKYA